MKIKKASRWLGLLLIMSTFAGCTQSTENIGAASPEAPNGASPTKIVTPILIPTPTDMPATVPTLPAEDARERLLELLATNGDCHLPCLWGITPGKSNDLESQSILLPLSSIAETMYFNQPEVNGILLGAITLLYVENDFRLNVRVAYTYSDNGIVTRIGFRVLEEQVTTDSSGNWISKQPVFDSTTFLQRTEYYSLSHVLTEQGVPSSVMMTASSLSDPAVAGGIDVALLYPEQGIWINYTMPMYNQGNAKSGCPVNAHMEMSLYPSGNPTSFFSLLEETDWGMTKNSYKPLEDATAISVEEFYEIFRNSTNNCIETPALLWP